MENELESSSPKKPRLELPEVNGIESIQVEAANMAEADAESPVKQDLDIFSLPDEILLKIYKMLSTTDILHIGKTCPRLYELSRTPELWIDVDNPPNSYGTLERIINRRVNSRTDSFRLVSSNHGDNLAFSRSSFLPSSLLWNLAKNAPNLTKLHLVRQKIDGNRFDLSIFPRTLRVLNLMGSYVEVKKYVTVPNDEQPYSLEDAISYFKGVSLYLPNLEDLDLSYCNWIVPYDLIHIRKFPYLTRLSLRGCSFKMSKFIPAIFADSPAIMRAKWRRLFSCLIAGGFFKLKILDMTNLPLHDSLRNGLFGHLACGSVHVWDEASKRYVPIYRSGGSNGIRNLEEVYIGIYDDDRARVRINYCGKLKVLDISGSSIEMIRAGGSADKVLMHFCTEDTVEELRRIFPNCAIERATMPAPPIQLNLPPPLCGPLLVGLYVNRNRR